MKQIFVFTAGNSAARQHLADSIINPVKEEIIAQHAPKELEAKIPEFKAKAGGVYCWGAEPGTNNERNWEAMRPGDIVFCVYDSGYPGRS
jgi:hypothetical protein